MVQARRYLPTLLSSDWSCPSPLLPFNQHLQIANIDAHTESDHHREDHYCPRGLLSNVWYTLANRAEGVRHERIVLRFVLLVGHLSEVLLFVHSVWRGTAPADMGHLILSNRNEQRNCAETSRKIILKYNMHVASSLYTRICTDDAGAAGTIRVVQLRGSKPKINVLELDHDMSPLCA